MICFFNSCREWGGGEKWHYEIAKELNKSMEVVVVTNTKSELFEKCNMNKLKTIRIKVTNISFLNLPKLIYLAYMFKRMRIKSIIVNLPQDLKLAGIAARLAGVKKVIYRRGSAIPIKNNIINRLLFKYVISEVIANSYETKKSILQNNRELIESSKINVIYNGINCQEYERREYEIIKNPEGVFTIGNAGRFVEQKGQMYLIDLACELKLRGKNFKIIIAGSGELEEKLKKYVIEKNVDKYIYFIGFKKNIKDLMESIDLFILTSKWEGFGYVLAEAMLSRKPVAGFDISSNSELIENGKNGFLVEPFDIKKMADIVEIVMDDKDKQIEMGESGYLKAIKEFEIKRVYEEIKKKL